MTFVSRVSTADFYRLSVESIQRQQAQAVSTQSQLSSGLKSLTAADDPTGAAHGLSLDQALSANARYTQNTQLASERLGLEENALSSVNDELNNVRDRVLQANGGTLTDADRKTIATTLRQSLAQILSYANAQDGEGRFLFAGSNDAAAPFSTVAGGSVVYSGDDVSRQLQIGPQRSVAIGDSGADLFQRIRSGNGTVSVAAGAANTGTSSLTSYNVSNPAAYDGGSYSIVFNGGNYQVLDSSNAVVASGAYTSGQSIQFRGLDVAVTGTVNDGDSYTVAPSRQQDLFTTISQIATVLETPTDGSPAARAQTQTQLLEGLSSLQTAQGSIVDSRAALGARFNAASDAASQLSAQSVQIQSALGSLRDVDYAQAVGQLNQQLTGLQAAQQSFTKIQGLSLFNYLR